MSRLLGIRGNLSPKRGYGSKTGTAASPFRVAAESKLGFALSRSVSSSDVQAVAASACASIFAQTHSVFGLERGNIVYLESSMVPHK